MILIPIRSRYLITLYFLLHTMEFLKILSQINDILKQSSISSDKLAVMENQLKKIRRRIDDPNLYLGIVGEFSSGKSTLINSLIGADFFKTNSLQGTTTVITKLYWGKRVDLSLNYKDGRSLHYHKDKRKILSKYFPSEYANLSFIQKISLLTKDLIQTNGEDEYIMKVFELTTTSNEISDTLNDVSIYYPSPILNNGLVIVDTPGTDSCIAAHAQITQRAIKEMCDTSIIVVPATKPLSMSIVDYIEENISDNISKCIFFVTKIEILRKAVERLQLIKGIGQRIQNYLGVENPNLIMAPTLLSLEERGIVEKSGILTHLQEDEKNNLCTSFDKDVQYMIDGIISQKEKLIQESICKFLHALTLDLNNELLSKEQKLESELLIIKQLRTKPLAEFMKDFFKQKEYINNYNYVESKLLNTWDSYCSDFRRYVSNEVDNASSKDEAQGIMDLETTRKYGQKCFVECYNAFISELNGLKSFYEKGFEDFKISFKNSFSIEAIDFEYKLRIDESWQKQYKLNFSKEGLTTFPLFRCFKSLQSIKNQMKEEVTLKINKVFSKMSKSYIERIQNAHAKLDEQMDKVKNIFFSKYEKIIQHRIEEEKQKEKKLESQIVQLKEFLSELETITKQANMIVK